MSETDFSALEQRMLAPGVLADPRVIPRFHSKPVEMSFKSQQAGRPIYEERDFVEIIIIGVRGSTIVEPVNDGHKQRWAREYEAFKSGQELPLEGTPLEHWPSVNRARVEELKFFHIRTVEQLAAVTDAVLPNLGMGAWNLRETAKKFLEVARTGTAPLERLVSENLRLRDELALKEQQIATQGAEIDRLRILAKEHI